MSAHGRVAVCDSHELHSKACTCQSHIQTLINASCSGAPPQHVAPIHTPRCHKQQRHYTSPTMARLTAKVMTEAQQSPSTNQATQPDPFPDSRSTDSTIQPIVEIIDLTKDAEVRCGHMLKGQSCSHNAWPLRYQCTPTSFQLPTIAYASRLPYRTCTAAT